MNTLTSPADNGRAETIDHLIARVLSRAHRAADNPNEARAILHGLSPLDPRFDRLDFIQDATEDPS